MGLSAKPGVNDFALAEKDCDAAKKAAVVELFEVPDSDELGKKKGKPIALNEEDQRYIAKCMAKYGDDYASMFRDIKVNKMQHTEQQLRKMGARFLLLSAEQRLVDVPAKVKQLAINSQAD